MNQPDPKPGETPIAPVVLVSLKEASEQHAVYVEAWPWLEKRLQERIEAGRVKYGTLLETNNGRNALEDAWQEAADLVQYLTQDFMEGNPIGVLLEDANRLFLRLSLRLWQRENRRMTCVTTPGPRDAFYEAFLKQKPVDDEAIYGPRDQWDDWRGASEPE